MTESPFTAVDPTAVTASDMQLPEPLDLEFEGWTPEVFDMLQRLREHPHIDQYQKEKPEVSTLLKEPFKRYRNDLVVNWVLPNRLDFETEKNVFSRLLKNDFGAGGCKDNLWLSFYRPGRRRLTDAQISHKISPDGFAVGLFVGGYMDDLLEEVKDRIQTEPERYLGLINPLLQEKEWKFYYRCGSGESKRKYTFTEPLEELPDELDKAKGIWIRRYMPRERVLDWQSDLVRHTLDAVFDVWPVYRFYLAGE